MYMKLDDISHCNIFIIVSFFKKKKSNGCVVGVFFFSLSLFPSLQLDVLSEKLVVQTVELRFRCTYAMLQYVIS